MKAFAVVFAGWLGFCLSPSIAQQPVEGWSNSGKLKYEVRGEKDAEKEIWILPEGKEEGAKKLADTMGWGNLRIHISPDDQIIVIQDGGGSIGIDLRVFRSDGKPGQFAEEKEIRIGDLLERWAIGKAKAKPETKLGHRYARLLGWSGNGKKALVSISGHEGELRIPGWFAIYDFDSGELSSDLEKMNE